ncbi:MAG: hypothetical protein U0166_12715 [Acidobacteriota bacterium]
MSRRTPGRPEPWWESRRPKITTSKLPGLLLEGVLRTSTTTWTRGSS